MRKIYEYSNDKDFLELIDNEHLKEQYVKITVSLGFFSRIEIKFFTSS